MIGKIKNFVSEVAKEMKKVTWPTRPQLKESTYVVIGATLFFTIFIYLIDWVMGLIIKFIFPVGS
jgi:preprotein translocase subunit SecE